MSSRNHEQTTLNCFKMIFFLFFCFLSDQYLIHTAQATVLVYEKGQQRAPFGGRLFSTWRQPRGMDDDNMFL